jgi:cell division protein FtsA
MNNRTYEQGDVVVALDIGTTKICALAGRKNEFGRIEILGVGKVESKGVLRGVVSNIDKTVKAISDAIDIAEKNAKIQIEDVFVGIAGQHIRSLQHRGILIRHHPEMEITKEDIDKLVGDVHKLSLGPGVKILHVIPQEYTVDDEQGIVDPIGMSGNKLEANFHIITGQIAAFNNIHRCIQKAGLNVVEMTLEPIASATAVLGEEEMEAGVALVDIGGGTTDLTIIHEGIIRHTAVIPFGGNIITKDVKEGCTVMNDQAEKLKIKFGSALSEEIVDNRIITIPGFKGRDSKEISEKNLAKIIQARVDEVLDYVYHEINRSGFNRKLIAGIVLTGGGSLLKHVDLLAQYNTGLPARIGLPVENLAHGYSEKLSSPIFSTGIGLLIHAINDLEKNAKPAKKILQNQDRELETVGVERESKAPNLTAEPKRPSWYEKWFDKTKSFFEATSDSEF